MTTKRNYEAIVGKTIVAFGGAFLVGLFLAGVHDAPRSAERASKSGDRVSSVSSIPPASAGTLTGMTYAVAYNLWCEPGVLTESAKKDIATLLQAYPKWQRDEESAKIEGWYYGDIIGKATFCGAMARYTRAREMIAEVNRLAAKDAR